MIKDDLHVGSQNNEHELVCFVGDYRVQTEHRLKAGGQLLCRMRKGFLTGRFGSASEGFDAGLELAQKITSD